MINLYKHTLINDKYNLLEVISKHFTFIIEFQRGGGHYMYVQIFQNVQVKYV